MNQSEFKKFLDKNPEIKVLMIDVYPTHEEARAAFNELAQDLAPRQINVPNSEIAKATGCLTAAILISSFLNDGFKMTSLIAGGLLFAGYFGIAKGFLFGANKVLTIGAEKPEQTLAKIAKDYSFIDENEKRVVKKRTLENGFKNGYIRYRAV